MGSLDQALHLAVKVLSKTLDVTKLTPDKVEMATLTREKGRTVMTILQDKAVEALIKVHEEEEAKADAQKKKSPPRPLHHRLQIPFSTLDIGFKTKCINSSS